MNNTMNDHRKENQEIEKRRELNSRVTECGHYLHSANAEVAAATLDLRAAKDRLAKAKTDADAAKDAMQKAVSAQVEFNTSKLHSLV